MVLISIQLNGGSKHFTFYLYFLSLLMPETVDTYSFLFNTGFWNRFSVLLFVIHPVEDSNLV